jgi:hypothetical protein
LNRLLTDIFPYLILRLGAANHCHCERMVGEASRLSIRMTGKMKLSQNQSLKE